MKTYVAQLKSIAPYSQSKHHEESALDKEQPLAYDRRTWRSKMHVDAHGIVQIPPMAIKVSLSEAAKYLGLKIPGKRGATFTKHFEAGVIVTQPVSIGIHANDVQCEELYVPSDGIRGSGKRVTRCFPLIRSWEGSAEIYVIDETITRDVLLEHLKCAGSLIGIGRFRPRNNGFYGRFDVLALKEAG